MSEHSKKMCLLKCEWDMHRAVISSPDAPEQNLLRWFWFLHTTRSKVAQGPLFMGWCSVRHQFDVPHSNRKKGMNGEYFHESEWHGLGMTKHCIEVIRTFTYKMHLVQRAAQVILYSSVARGGVPVSEHPPTSRILSLWKQPFGKRESLQLH